MSNILKIAGAGVSAAEETDANFKQTVLLLHGDGTNGAQNNTFLDSGTANSGSGFTITRNGNTTQGTFSPFSASDGRWSVYLNGSSDVSFPSDAAFDFGTGSWQVECWIYPTTSVTTAVQAIMTRQEPSTDQAFNFRILNTGKLDITLRANGGTNLTSITSTNSIVANTWTHVAVSFNSATGTVELFINGSSEGTASFSYNLTPDTSRNFRIGVLDTTGSAASSYFTGYISNVRVLKGGFIYSGSYTVPTSPLTDETNTTLLTVQSNRFVDNSSGLVATPRGTPSITSFSPFAPTAAYDASVNGGSAYLDGTGDYLSVGGGMPSGQGTAFTMELWAYFANLNDFRIITRGTSSSSLDLNVSSTGVVALNDTGTAVICNSAAGVVKAGTWHHIALTRTTGNLYTIYVDGVSVASGSNSTSMTANGTIGYSSFSASHYFVGYMSGFRVTNTLVYSSAFTPPTAPPTAISGTSLLLNFTNAGIFDNTGKNNLETVGNAQIDTTTKKYGTGSMEFDGTGDWLLLPNNKDLSFEGGDFTVEFWFYANSVPSANYAGFVGFHDGLDNNTWAAYLRNTGVFFYGSSATLTGGGSPSATTWHHYAACRSGGTIRVFLDGVQVDSDTVSGTYVDGGLTLRVGNDNAATNIAFNGFIDDLRITKGVARYTTTFTPPDKAFADL